MTNREMAECATAIEPILTDGAMRHVAAYLRRLFGDAAYAQLDSESLRDAFDMLLRCDEFLTTQRYKDCCWEPCYSSNELRYAFPFLDQMLPAGGAPVSWPQGKRFALCLTHDVDHLVVHQHQERFRALRWGRGASWRDRCRLAASGVWHSARALTSGEREYPLDIWLLAEQEFDFRSTFFFMAAPPPQPNWRDGMYLMTDRLQYEGRCRSLLDVLPELARAGWEVGLHGSIASAFDANLARHERLRLSDAAQTEIISGRQHYLNYDIRVTPTVHENAGIQVDSSLGSNINPFCYRAGTGFPFPMYDLVTDRPLNLVQVPLIVQDNPLLESARGETSVAVRSVVDRLEEAARRGSMVTLLFHNTYTQQSPAFQAYREILAAAHDLGAWGCTVGQAYRWYQRQLAG